MSLTTSSLELANALKAARAIWEDTKAGWKDPVSHDFEANHWGPLATQVEATIGAIDRLAPVLSRALRDCS
jgi:hypothetical protein